MKTYDLLRQYVWLLNTIHYNGPISLDKINIRWTKTEMSGHMEIGRSTFIRHKNAIADTFGIDIECDRRTNRYYIGNPQALRDNSVQQWMISAITVSNIVSESLSLQNHILLENIPVEGKLLSLIIEAMKAQRCISFQYKKHKDISPTERLIIPCCIKLFRQRWYVIQYNHENTSIPYKAFAFDRISNLTITNKKYVLPDDFDAEEIFANSFGIYIGDSQKPQRIVIRAFGDQSKYIRDLPLHHSQKQINECEDYADYEYYVRPSFDFIAELLSKGERIEVLSPQNLREKMYEELLQAAKRYKK